MRGTSFQECNVKCADFSNADLTDAVFELAAIES
ncbi:MAG: pentapeptide repeat-containing protein, partial [Burkholderiales bacterium]|nr:pentapeptide repeat-containing protein [Burkholderiales bacterium]